MFINDYALVTIGVQYKWFQPSIRKNTCENTIGNITKKIRSKSLSEPKSGERRIQRNTEKCTENITRKTLKNSVNITENIGERLKPNLWFLWGGNVRIPNVVTPNVCRLSKSIISTLTRKNMKVSPVHGKQCGESLNSGKKEKSNSFVQTATEKNTKNSLKKNPTDEPKTKTNCPDFGMERETKKCRKCPDKKECNEAYAKKLIEKWEREHVES